MPLYAGKHAICAFLRNMLRSHVRYINRYPYLLHYELFESLWTLSIYVIVNSCIETSCVNKEHESGGGVAENSRTRTW